MTENTNPAATDAGLRERIRDALVSVARRHGDWRLRDARSAMADAVMRVLNLEWQGLRIDNDRLQAELATYKEALRDTLVVDSEIRCVVYKTLGLSPSFSVADLGRALERLASRPAIPADAEDLAWSACMDDDKFFSLNSGEILEVIRRTLKAIASAAPVSGSDCEATR